MVLAKGPQERALARLKVSIIQGSYKLAAARMTHLSALLIMNNLRKKYTHRSKSLDSELETYIAPVKKRDIDSYAYISDCAHIIYITAVFDSFLSDITKILILKYPSSIKESFTADYDQIIKSKNINALKSNIVGNKVRELSYKSFSDRIRFIKRTFGVKPNISPQDFQNIEIVSRLRNELAHGQSYCKFSLTRDGEISIQKISEKAQHSRISENNIKMAYDLYEKLSQALLAALESTMISNPKAPSSSSAS